MASCTALLNHVEALSTNDKFTDVVLIACADDGISKDLPSHLCILARSTVFERMFSGAFAESALKRVEIPVIKVKHLEILREYLYTDKMEFAADWTAHDCVNLIALCDKYEVPSAFSLVSGELMKQLDSLSLSDCEQVVDDLSAAVSQQAIVQEALNKLASKVDSGIQVAEFLDWLQRFHGRSGSSVLEALTNVVPKVQFGSQVMLLLIWLQQYQRCSGQVVKTVQDACLQKVCADQDFLEKELALNYGNAEELDVMRARMLMTSKFLEQVGASLQTVCHGTGFGSSYCSASRCTARVSVNVSTSTKINITEKKMLSFGIGRLMEDMNAAFTKQAEPLGNKQAGESAKRQKTS
eukprot:TRINITY_DN60733_c0_g1_i1.p1 TRINITY_DN60733_c0_g1~~TRINITY_DN60733_c0_g1_i1.p1  ORF type:complete len:378 (+),score=63.01 TRINITY_DN60733_c0_g1_i1:77-1135(+)